MFCFRIRQFDFGFSIIRSRSVRDTRREAVMNIYDSIKGKTYDDLVAKRDRSRVNYINRTPRSTVIRDYENEAKNMNINSKHDRKIRRSRAA